MNGYLIVLAVAIFAGLIGIIVGGIAEDVLWLAFYSILPECEKMQGEWEKTCKNANRTYYTVKTVFQTVGFVAPFIVVFSILRKLE